jgi:L-asparaginase/Glu-tRNA(Gln) amidotransferase subunit D
MSDIIHEPGSESVHLVAAGVSSRLHGLVLSAAGGGTGPVPLTPRPRAAHDSTISVVLAVHVAADRPLGSDQVVELSGNLVTRDQVKAAGSALCRDGQLDRIRSGVYQWSQGQRPGARQAIPQAHARIPVLLA